MTYDKLIKKLKRSPYIFYGSWVAVDKNGTVFLFLGKPRIIDTCWEGDCCRVIPNIIKLPKWKDSLVQVR